MRDVRMRGFAERADVADVDRRLRELARPLPAESVSVLECAGRVLVEDVVAEFDVPGFRRAAMDGYAVRGEDTTGATERDPRALEIAGEAYPGQPFAGRVGPKQAVRVMTGAPVPDAADAVVRVEVCEERDGRVYVRASAAPGLNVGEVGEDVRAGRKVLGRGRRLRAQDAAVLASIGRATLRCVRRPRVQLVITGDELLAPGSAPEGCRIVDSNSVLLRALVERDGGALLPTERVPDRPEQVRAALAREGADVTLVSGGSSVGSEDHAPRLVAELGALDFHGVALRPSAPSGGGRIGERLVFLLPGNPVSCLCAYEFFAGPSLRALGGRSRAWPHRRVRLPLARELGSRAGRTDYVRVAIEDGAVVPIASGAASVLSSTVRAAGAVIVPHGTERVPRGAEVEVLLYDDEALESADSPAR